MHCQLSILSSWMFLYIFLIFYLHVAVYQFLRSLFPSWVVTPVPASHLDGHQRNWFELSLGSSNPTPTAGSISLTRTFSTVSFREQRDIEQKPIWKWILRLSQLFQSKTNDLNHDPIYYSSQESNSVSPHLPNSQSATAVAVEYGTVHLMETLSCHIRGGNGLRAYCCRIIVRFVVHMKLE